MRPVFPTNGPDALQRGTVAAFRSDNGPEVVAKAVREWIAGVRRYGMPVVNPLIFYPWRVIDALKVVFKWAQLVRRFRRIQARVEADPLKECYLDEALTPAVTGAQDHFVEIFTDKILKTHGAPKQRSAVAG